jgi:hypothetical protein
LVISSQDFLRNKQQKEYVIRKTAFRIGLIKTTVSGILTLFRGKNGSIADFYTRKNEFCPVTFFHNNVLGLIRLDFNLRLLSLEPEKNQHKKRSTFFISPVI